MRKLILNWLFGTDNVKSYMKLLWEYLELCKGYKDSLDDHIETLEEAKKNLSTVQKLIKICDNHGIDVNEEIKHIELQQEEI